MGDFLKWLFGPRPADCHRDAAAAADKWWKAAGRATSEFTALGPVPVRIFVCGGKEILREQFFKRHGTWPTEDVGEGYFWASDGEAPGIDAQTEAEFWLIAKDTGKHGIIQKWAGGHELMRLVDLLYRLQTGSGFGDAGRTDRADYYG